MPEKFTAPSPVRIAYGEGRIDKLGDDLARLGGDRHASRVLLVSDPGVAEAGLTGRVAAVLERAGVDAAVFTELKSDPLAASADAAAAAAHRKAGATTLDAPREAAAPIVSAHPRSASGNLTDAQASPAVPFLPGNKRTRSLWVFFTAGWYEGAHGYQSARARDSLSKKCWTTSQSRRLALRILQARCASRQLTPTKRAR